MIKFFRKQSHHLKNRWFYYGLDTLVVIVGVLIALWLNNWNEVRKTKSVSYEYLNNIKDDLTADTLSLDRLKNEGKLWKIKLGNYYDYYYKGDWSAQEIVDSCLNTGFTFSTYLATNNTYVDMLSSGNTNLLSDIIRKSLSNLKSKQDLYTYILDKTNLNMMNSLNEVVRYWNIEKSIYFKESFEFNNKPFPTKDFSVFSSSNEDLMKGLKHHHNIFSWMYKRFHYNHTFGDDIKHDSKRLLKLINEELEH